MLYKRIDTTTSEWPLVIWRYWCECMTPSHVLELVENGDEDKEENLTVCITNDRCWSFLRRLKESIKLLFNRDVCYLEVVISSEDRKELGRVILGDHIVT